MQRAFLTNTTRGSNEPGRTKRAIYTAGRKCRVNIIKKGKQKKSAGVFSAVLLKFKVISNQETSTQYKCKQHT